MLSGLGSLALEVVWTRQLRLVFGSTTLAASTILVAYMLGLGLGALAGARIAARVRDGIRAYGWFELAIAAYALAVPFLLDALPLLNRTWLHALPFWPAALLRFAICLAVFLLPTVLMGATLPVAISAVVRVDPAVARATGLLYGLNTLGAVGGVLLATFVLFPTVGLDGTNRAGAALDAVAGLLALGVVARRVRPEAPPSRGAHTVPAARLGGGATPVLVAYGVVGFTALVYEVAWFRALSMILGSSVYAFSAMLAAFLTGIALGSLAARPWLEGLRRPRLVLAVAIAALGAVALATTLVLPWLARLFPRIALALGIAHGRFVAAQVATATLAMLPPTLILGATFPLVVRVIAADAPSAAAAVGAVYFANALGSALGAFTAGFVLVPRLGLVETLALAAGLDLAVAALLLVRDGGVGSPARPWRAVPLLVAAAAVAFLPLPWDRRAMVSGPFRDPRTQVDVGIDLVPLESVPPDRLLFYRDGVNTTVSVERIEAGTVLKVNGKPDASTSTDMPTQILLGAVPMLFGPPPERVLVIGLASGITVGAVARHPVAQIDVAEIEPAVVDASHFFDDLNGRPLDDPRVRLVLDDGRTYLSKLRADYDVVISEPSNPWISGVSNLFTREFFRTVRAALRPGGRLMQWLQLYEIDEPSLLSVVAALRAEFPYVYAFSATADAPDLLLLGSLAPLGAPDLPAWERLPAPVRAELEAIGIASTPGLLSLLRLLPEDVDTLAGRAEVMNTDRNLFLELRAPRALYDARGQGTGLLATYAAGGALPLLERVGPPLDADAVGALALAYAQDRRDVPAATRLLEVAGARGASAHALAARVAIARLEESDETLDAAEQVARLDEAVALAPDAPEVRLLRGEARLEADQAAAALEDADAVLARRPHDARARLLRARALTALDRLPEAIAAMDAAVPSWRTDRRAEAVRDFALLHLRAGRLDDGSAALERYLAEFSPQSSDGWLQLADAYQQRGDAAGAARARRDAARAARNVGLRYHRAARRAMLGGSWDRARLYLEALLRRDPDDAAVREDLARLPPATRR
jgi:spermidine synthase